MLGRPQGFASNRHASGSNPAYNDKIERSNTRAARKIWAASGTR
jgi:hypothetical protein